MWINDILPHQIACGNDITTISTKKRAYKRKDCGDTTNTPTATETKKSEDSTLMEIIKKKRPYRRKKYLPHDLVVEQILTKLPVPTLVKSVLVSKLWYNSIHNDHKHLTYSHFLESQKQPNVILSLLNVKADDMVVRTPGQPEYECHFFKFTTGMYDSEYVLRYDKFRGHAHAVARDISVMVGYCRGLPCVSVMGKYGTAYMILDPNRPDGIFVSHPAKVGKCISNTRIICHGFGFDPSANEYKLVSVFRTAQQELNFAVFTLGSKSWRNVSAASMLISGLCGRPILKIRAPTGCDKSAIFCTTSSNGGSPCLVWKIITTLGGAVSNEMEMLLSFSLHDEEFQLIQLAVKSTTDEQQKQLLIDYPHLLQFKGFPCIARLEKISANGSDYPHRCRDDHQGSSCCCCCCKVHLYILKDIVKQVWVKEESFDVRANLTPIWLRTLAADACCFCLGNTTEPPTRIFSYSDQVLLYWFNGKDLLVYNLRSGKLHFVMPFSDSDWVIFGTKRNESQHFYNSGDGDDNYSSNMDYQLHCHEENFLSLDSFIPEGVEGVSDVDFNKADLNRCSAYVFIYRGSRVYYPSFN